MTSRVNVKRRVAAVVAGVMAAGLEQSGPPRIEGDRIIIPVKPQIGWTPPQRIEQTALYRHFDKDGKLLYVGISVNPIQRLQAHEVAAHWYGRISHVEIEWYETRAIAEAAERATIIGENPECNISGKVAA
jgi:hypothetical protein